MDETHIETGLSGETVNQPVALPMVIVPPPTNLTTGTLTTLAREMAIEVRDPVLVLAEYKITQAQYEVHVLTNEFYKRALEAYCIEWRSALSTNQRIKVQAGAVLEDSLPQLANRMTNGKETLASVVETAKLFTKLAGAGEEKKEGTPGEKFTINIHIGDKNLKVETNPEPLHALGSSDQNS